MVSTLHTVGTLGTDIQAGRQTEGKTDRHLGGYLGITLDTLRDFGKMSAKPDERKAYRTTRSLTIQIVTTRNACT